MPPTPIPAPLRDASDAMPAPVAVLDVGGHVLHWNQACAELAPCPLDESRGRPFAELAATPAEAAAVARAIEEVHAGRPAVRVTFRWRDPAGASRATRWSLGASGGGIVALALDVSERECERDGREQGTPLLDAIFELIPVGLWIADRDGKLVRTNAAGQRVWGGARYVGPSGYSEYEGWWADTGEPIRPDDWAVARAVRDRETSLGEIIRIRCFDGSQKTIINSAMPIHDEHGELAGVVVVNEDITGLREIEDALRRAVLARDEVLGVVAHDLRSPLNAIVLQLHLLGRSGTLDPRQAAALELMKRQTTRMRRMIEDLLDSERIDEGRLTLERARVRVATLAEEVVEPLRPAAEEMSIALGVEIADGAGEVWGDAARLARALDNLVVNALKFTPPGGRIAVRAASCDGAIVLSVTDTGPGIPAEALPHVFDRFWQQGPADRRGVGLGLAIVKGIVEAHGGQVSVESRAGEGTTFSFTVPSADPGGVG